MLWGSIVFVALGKTVVFSRSGLHQKWWRYFNIGDTWAIVRACGARLALMLAVFTLAQPFSINIPRSVLILDFAFTVGLLVAGRSLVRFVRRGAAAAPAAVGADVPSVLIVGAGSGGQMVVRELLLNPSLGDPVGFVDDDPAQAGDAPGRRPQGARDDRRDRRRSSTRSSPTR